MKTNNFGEVVTGVIVNGHEWSKKEVDNIIGFYPPKDGKYYWSFHLINGWIMLTGYVRVILTKPETEYEA